MKISKKYYVSDKSALGNMLPLWEMLHKELTEIYTIHAVMSLKIMEDIEQPLRASIQGNPEYGVIKSMDANLQRISRDYEDRLTRLNKHKNKPKKTSETETKITDITRSLEECKAQWLQVGPEYIQKHQALDEHRLNTLRSSIQNFEVLQNDQLLKRIEVANNVLTAASTFDVSEEISAFASSNAKAATASSSAQFIQRSVSHSGRSIVSVESFPIESLPVPSHPESGPVPVPSISEKSYRSIGAQSTGSKSTSGKKLGKERKFLSGLVSIRRKAKSGSHSNGYMIADLEPPVAESCDQHSTSSFGMVENSSSFSNGFMSEREEINDSSRMDVSHSPAPTSPTSIGSPPSVKGPPSITGSIATASQPPKVLVDDEGYTIPPSDRAAWPAESTTTSALLDDDFGSDNGSLFGNQRLKVDIKTEAVADSDAAQSRVALTRVSSMLKERSTVPTGKRRGRRENRTTRLLDPVAENKTGTSSTEERRATEGETASFAETEVLTERKNSVPALVLEENQSTPAAHPRDGNPEQQPIIPVIVTDTPVLGEQVQEQSTVLAVASSSGDSVFGDHLQSPFDDLSSAAHLQDIPAPVSAPIVTPQIKVSIMETIHCLLKGGEVIQSAVIGDVNITYSGPADVADPVFFKLDGIEALERVAPNTSYITPVDDQPGVFCLNTNMYYFAGDSPVPSLKYQIKVDDDPHKILPIWAKPMWKCDEDQTRLLVKFRKTGYLGDIHGIFFTTIVSGNVQHVQSIPAGQWMVDQERMVWPIGEWQDQDEHLLRAKFSTTQEGAPQPLAIRFEGKGWLVSDVSIVNNHSPEGLQRAEGGVWADVRAVEKSVRTGKYMTEA
ncbi:Muniscin C-terminal mu homology domain-containing protein [Dichotomocladium elegans]|nr:Muniscin C-terminal mu homology domain-containing protein [Dichotomocladium elegans]